MLRKTTIFKLDGVSYTFILQNKQKYISSLRLENESTVWKFKIFSVTQIFQKLSVVKSTHQVSQKRFHVKSKRQIFFFQFPH